MRLAIGNHPRAGAERIVRLLKDQGVDVGAGLVKLVQSEMRGGGKAIETQGGGRPKGDKGTKGSRTTSRRTRSDGL